MEYASYSITKSDLQLLAAWPMSASKPALFLTVHSVRDVDERDLVRPVRPLSYKASGLTGASARHRL